MSIKINPPYLGSAYYPEDWDESQIDSDIAEMVGAGFNVARVGEFAWRKMEPAEGKYDFSWLHRVVDKLAAAGIKTIMGTPTATPPIWLSRKHPDIMAVMDNGRQKKHGGRRHCCSNNPHYRAASVKIVEALAREFGGDENIIGWQIDNEIYRDCCFCPVCLKGFTEYLAKKYGSIDNLNAAWNLNLFSQAYDSFDEVPPPSDAWHNPHLHLEWNAFQSESQIAFVHMQNDILKKHTSAPVGTDMMPLNGMDYEKTTEPLDIIEFNHYNTRENLWSVQFWLDFLRTLKDRPFWNTETQTSWNGSVQIGQTIKPEGFCRANSWLPVALGGEANLYWLWRTHWAGHELMHGSVLSTCGRPTHVFGEIQQTAADFKKAGDFLNRTRVSSKIALHFTSANWSMFETQSVVSNLKYSDELINRFYRPIIKAGFRPDIIGARRPLSGYDILVSPLMLTLEDRDLSARIAEWVRAGGTWVAGPMTDVRDSVGAKYKDSPFGMLEELAGVRCLYQIPDSDGYIKAAWRDGSPFTGSRWYDVFAPDADSLADITFGHSELTGKSVLLKKRVGKGEVIVLGTIPSEEDMVRIITDVCAEKGLRGYRITGDVSVVPRSGDGLEGLILVECAGNHASVETGKVMTDLLTGNSYGGHVELEPYGVLVLE